MSREIENITASFRKARINGIKMMKEKRITKDEYQDCMRMYEERLRQAGASL